MGEEYRGGIMCGGGLGGVGWVDGVGAEASKFFRGRARF